MKNRFLYLKRMLRTVLLILLLSIAGMTKAQTENITFADAIVKAYCVANWDANGDGELNQAEAAAVTSLDGVFMFDGDITSFNELQFFSGLTSFGVDEFNSCTNLASITIPNAVTSIGNYAFSDCSSLTTMTSYACTPPILGNEVFYNVPSVMVLNVPCHTSAMYQEADGWSDFTNYEEFEYDLCPIPFADATVKAICVAHWDTNSDGELSYAEAAAVTNLGTYFKSTAITSFDELEYFTSLTSLPNTAFYGCTSLASIALPASVSALGNGSFYNCTNLATMTVYAETPPTVGTNALKNVPIEMVVYVPCGTYEAYHIASGWNEFSNVLEFGSCPIVFADANVKALCVANWDTNGDGELSYDEAAEVTDLGQVFRTNYSITSFDELQYFINLTSINFQAFSSCQNLTSVIVSNSVTSIGNSAFAGCSSLNSIEIPNSVTSIGVYAFNSCISLISIEIPNSVTSIGSYAFQACSGLTSIEIPSSVTNMGENPFNSCSGLEQIVVDSDNMTYDSRENCNAIIKTSTNQMITGCKNTIIPNTVTSIKDAFWFCSNLVSIEIPNSVTSIIGEAFRGCTSLTSIEIPNSVTSISSRAFAYCHSLEQIIVDSGNTVYDSRENCNAIINTYSNVLIAGCKNTNIPNSVTSIGYCAFEDCANLTSIEIPNSVSFIGDYAFGYCGNLSSMTVLRDIPPALDERSFLGVNKSIPIFVPTGSMSAYQTAFGWSEFTNYIDYGSAIVFTDVNVKSICVSHWDTNGDGELSYAEAASVTSLGNFFQNNPEITSFDELRFFSGLSSINNNAFQNCSGLTSIVFPKYLISIGDYAFSGCSGFTGNLIIPNFITEIGDYAFYGCDGFTGDLTIPNSMVEIGNYAFYGCSGFTGDLIIPNTMTEISDGAFYGCSGINGSLTIPSTVTSISQSAFFGCIGLSSIVSLTETPATLESYTFYNVNKSIPVYVPNGMVSTYQATFGWSEFTNYIDYGSPIIFVDDNVKALCVANWDANGDGELSYDEAASVTDLREVFKSNSTIISFDEFKYFLGLTSIRYDAFYGCTGLTSIELPNSVSSIGGRAFGGCSGISGSLNIPNSVTSIGPDVFSGCSGLTSIEIPNSVTSIGSSAFFSCSGLTSIEIPNSVTSIGSSAFSYCSGLTSIEIPNSVCIIGGNPVSFCSNLEQIIVDLGNMVYNSRENCNAIINTSTNELKSGCKNTVILNSVTSIGSGAFAGCSGLTWIEIPNSLTSIGYMTFYGCSGLTSIKIPNSVTSIDVMAFEDCSGLISIEIPNSITTIGAQTFYGCSGLTSITVLADTPPSLGSNVFYNVPANSLVYVPCDAVEDYQSANGWSDFTNIIGLCAGEVVVTVNPTEGGTVTGAGYYSEGDVCVLTAAPSSGFVFSNWTENGVLVSMDSVYSFYAHPTTIEAKFVPIGNIVFADTNVKTLCVTNWDTNGDGELSYYEAAMVTNLGQVFRNNSSVTSFNELQYFINLTSIGQYAFYYCNGLISIEIPNSVTSIGDGAFFNCTSLTSIAIPNSVTLIRGYAFYFCTSLTSLEIPNSVTSIGNSAFRNCRNLNSIEIPNSVISLASQVFSGCSGLTSLTIPNSVTSIGYQALYGCISLNSMTVLAETPPTLGSDVFYNVNKSIPMYVPCSASEVYQNTDGWSDFTNIMGMCPGTITVAASPTEGGMITGGGSYEGGTICTLIATANHGYRFSNWTENGEMVSSEDEYSFVVTEDRNIVANFIAMPPLPIVAEYHPDPNEPNSPYVKVHWAASSFEAQIGEGTSTFGYFPFYTLYNFSISENLFLASELEEAGVNTAPMTSLSWYATNATGYAQQGISIWMANVNDTELTTTSHTVNGMTLVYTGTMTPEIGWNEFVFNEGNFAWDGTSNVLIFCQRNNGVWNSAVYWQAVNVGFNASSYRYQDSGPYNVTIANTMYTSTMRPNIIMNSEGAMTYNIYRANCDGSNTQLVAENLNDTQYIDETWWQLENNSYKYGVSIADSTSTDIFWSNCIEKQGDVVVQTVALSEGWNWFSTYIEREPVELLDMLKESLSENGIQIESQYDGLTEKIGDGYWWGDLDEVGIMNESMYLIEVAADCTIELEGTAVDPADHEITLYPEWTWIGFPCTEEVDIVVALSGLEAEEGDMIEGPDGVAEYLGGGFWYGIETLVPGQGYMYYSASDESKTLVFQTGRSKAKVKSGFIGNKAPKMSIERKVESWD